MSNENKNQPIVSWGIWVGGLSFIMGLVTRNHILAGFRADETGMSFVIAALFVGGLAASFRAAMQLHSEWGVLDRVVATKQVPLANGKSGLADIFNRLADYKRKGATINIHTAIDDTPPEWLMSELLEPLGFDQAVICGLRKNA